MTGLVEEGCGLSPKITRMGIRHTVWPVVHKAGRFNDSRPIANHPFVKYFL